MTARTAHGPDCGCTRCRGFEPGNEVGLRHGAYSSPVRFEGRVAELAPQLADLVPAFTDADGPVVQLLALTFARIEKVAEAVAAADGKAAPRLLGDLRAWIGTAHRLLDSLAMTPASRGRLGLDIAQTKRALGDLDALAAEGRRVRESRGGASVS